MREDQEFWVACQVCPSGTIQPSTSSATCYVPCVSGTTGSQGGCSRCATSTWKATTGSDACTVCSPNSGHTITQQTDKTTCLCDLGYTRENCGTCTASGLSTYKTVSGSSTCINCNTCKTSPSGSTSSTACINCLTGTYLLAGSSCTNYEACKYKEVPIEQTLRCGGQNCVSGCTPSNGVFSGTISNGPGNYVNNTDCWWAPDHYEGH